MRNFFKQLFKTVFLIIAPIILLGVIFLYVVFNKFVEAAQPTYQNFELIHPDGHSKLYIKTQHWGVTGDGQLTIITADEEFNPDSTNQIIFKGLEPFRYKQSSDTLTLYVNRTAIVPKGFNASWVIVQKKIDSVKMTDVTKDHEYKGI